MSQRSIGIFMILYNNKLCWDEYNLCRSYYDRMINIYNMPITIYGVCYENIPEDVVEGGLIKLSTTPERYDKDDRDTARKWFDLITSPVLPEHDVYVRLTPSSALNICLLNYHVQSPDYNPEVVYASYFYRHQIGGVLGDTFNTHIYPRGNLVVMSQPMIQDMIKDFNENGLDRCMYDGAGIHDDQLIGTSLFRYHSHPFKAYNICAIYEKDVEPVSNHLKNLHDVMVVACKAHDINQEEGDLPGYVLEVMKIILSMWEMHYWVQVYYGNPFPGLYWFNDSVDDMLKVFGYTKPE